ncbi:MAG TPA: TetR/AcrR family transcriptional regulator [Catenuloplanes sp.]|jgi:AcrR family transcriptional regulator
MTAITPSRRERLRTTTVAELKAAARRQLVTGGPAAVSLRAIARDLGMTAPAIYRYFASLDALIVALTVDFYAELRHTVEAARDRHPPDQPLRRLGEMARGFRQWARQHPAEFALMFGSPVPGVTDFDRLSGPVQEAGARFGAAFLDAFGELYARHRMPAPPAQLLDERFTARLGPYAEALGDRFPLPVVYVFLAGWTRLYGLVATEVFGHLQWAMTDAEPLFELELARIVDDLAGPPTADP